MDKKNITIYNIAKEAGVSPSTVSRVITGNVGVAKDKEERIRAIIEKYHFIPNAMAKGLKEKRSKVIGVIVPNINNPYFSNLFYEIQMSAIKEDLMVLLCNTNGDPKMEMKMFHTLIHKQVEAMVIIGGALDDKDCSKEYIKEIERLARYIPVIITTPRKTLGCIKVVNDDEQCMKLMAEHLADRGYQKIALIGGNEEIIPSAYRRKYFFKYTKKNNLIVRKNWIINGGFDIKSGMMLMQKLWSYDEKPDAVCGINDLVALGILKYAYEKGISIPADLGVMGCDGINLGETSSPALSTVATHYHVFGETVIKAILTALGNKTYQDFIIINMELKKRQST